MRSQSTPQPIVVGVSRGQAPHIVLQAARFAAQFRTELVCAHVDTDRFEEHEKADGSEQSTPIDPDFADDFERQNDDWLDTDLDKQLGGSDIAWRSIVLAGDVSTALARLADRIDAAMIVVGTHEKVFTGTLQELFVHSVATNLAHRQTRPVVVIPTRLHGESSPFLTDTR